MDANPQFRPPTARGRYARTPEEVERRLARLARIGRRCDYNGRRCVNNAATWRLTVRTVDATRQPTGEPYQVLTCSRHKKVWTNAPDRFVVVEEESLPPQNGR